MNDDNRIIGPGQGISSIDTSDVKIIDDNNELPVTKEVKEKNQEYEKSLKGLYDYIASKDTKDLIMVFVRILIIIMIIFIFKYPFDIIKEMGISIFDMCGLEITDLFLKIWNSSINILYYVLALITFISVVSKRYDNLLKKDNNND